MFEGLYKLKEQLRPNFEEGGKLHAFWSLFDGFESFLFTPNTTGKRLGSQIHAGNDSKRTMIYVVLALVPCLLFGMYNVGYQHLLATGQLVGGLTAALFWKAFGFGLLAVLPYILVSYIVGLGIEFTVAQWKHEEIAEGFLVTGFLIPLIVPINTPLWMVAVATAFAVIFAKEVFGGTGYNIFNVALITRAFLFFAYPTHMTGDKAFIRTGSTWGWDGGHTLVDGFSGATPLTQLATGTSVDLSFWDMVNGLVPGSVGETCVWAILMGACLLLVTRTADWRIMCSIILTGAVTAFQPVRCSRQSCSTISVVHAPRIRRFPVRRCIHGYRSCYRSPHRLRQVVLRHTDRLHGSCCTCAQPGLSRGHDAGYPARQRCSTADRLVCCSSQY